MKKIHYKIINSTSTYLKNNYEKLENLTFVSADFQTKGHGRNNRSWFSENKENLLFSILIKDKNLIEKHNCLSLASAVCIYEVLKELHVNNVMIKWPNDVFVSDKKIAGILLESVSTGNNIEALVIGVGINVNCNKFNNGITNKATSIYLEKEKKINLEEIKNNIYNKFIKMLEEIKNNNSSYLEIIRKNNYLKDKMVYANVNNIKTLVRVIDINNDNSLKVKIYEEYIDLYSGEITFHI